MQLCAECERETDKFVTINNKFICVKHIPYCSYCGISRNEYYTCDDTYCVNIRCIECIKKCDKKYFCELHK